MTGEKEKGDRQGDGRQDVCHQQPRPYPALPVWWRCIGSGGYRRMAGLYTPGRQSLYPCCRAEALAGIASYDLHDGVLAQSDVPTDQAIAEAITVQVEHLLCLLVAGSLALFPT